MVREKTIGYSVFRRGGALLLCLAVLAGCTANRLRKTTSGARGAYCSSGDVGVASWYGKDFHGRKTSNGEVYNMYGFSAAHRTLPFGTVLRVTECQRGKSVHVTVNDRGPFVPDREIDLSFGAAKAIGMVADGIAEVGIQIVESPSRGTGSTARVKRPTITERDRSVASSDPRTEDVGASSYSPPQSNGGSRFLVQVGAYQVKDNALRMRERVAHHHAAVYMETQETNIGPFHRVRIGPYPSEAEAEAVANQISLQVIEAEPVRPVVVRED